MHSRTTPADGDPGPSRKRALRSGAAPRAHPGVRDAAGWTAAKFSDRHRGGKYSGADLAALFAAVAANPRIRVAPLFDLLRDGTGGADRAIRAFADGLQKRRGLVAANLGEYAAAPATWDHLTQKVRGSDLGHLYVSEENLSGLRPAQKRALIGALRANRSGKGYLREIVRPGRVREVRSVNPWWAPPAGRAWVGEQRARLAGGGGG